MNGTVLTVESLREELRSFAGAALRRELEDLKQSILSDLRQEGLQRRFPPLACQAGQNGSAGSQDWMNRSERSLKLVAKEEGGSRPVPVEGTMYATDDARTKDGYMSLRSNMEASILDGIEEEEAEPLPDAKQSQSCLARIIMSDTFNGLVSVVIFLNIVFIAAQTDYMARYWTRSRPVAFKFCEVAFCTVYLTEMVLRLAVLRKAFFFGKGCKLQGWNLFDFVLVVIQVSDLLLSPLLAPGHHKTEGHEDEGHEDEGHEGEEHHHHESAGGKVAARAMMGLRALRIVRVFRIARVLHLVPNLRMLLNSLAFSIKSLVWVVLLVVLTILVFGIILTQVVADHKLDVGREVMEEQEALEEFFGTLDRSMLALYQIITDGLHWAELSEPLMEFISPYLVVVIILYTMFATFAMMNVLTAFFCENLAKAGQEDKNVQVYQEIWKALNSGGADSMTEEEFTTRMDEPEMKSHLVELELTPEEIRDSHFFQLIDKDHSGTVTIKELMTGCVRLTQSAKAVDVLGLALDVRREKEMAEANRDRVEAALEQIVQMMPTAVKASR